jgi:hypothetical protein
MAILARHTAGRFGGQLRKKGKKQESTRRSFGCVRRGGLAQDDNSFLMRTSATGH